MKSAVSQTKLATLSAVLVSRTFLFLIFQSLFALFFLATGRAEPWNQSAGWWPYCAAFTNLVSIWLLVWLYRREGKQFLESVQFERGNVGKDILITLGIFAISAPLSTLPNLLLGEWLFGSSEAVLPMMFRPMPAAAAWVVLFFFPITIAFAELPTYFGYLMPRITRFSGKAWLGLTLPALMLAFQHVTLPLIFDWRFILWRLGMFIPFAFFLGFCIQKRPRLMPYLMIGHALIDMSTVIMILTLPPA